MRVAAFALALALVAALAFASVTSAGEERPRFYRWTDAQGVVHYTNDLSLVPEGARAGAAIPRTVPTAAPEPAPPVDTAPPKLPAPEPTAAEPVAMPTPDVEAGAQQAAAIEAPPTPGLEIEEVAPEDSPDVIRLKQLITEDRERIKALLAGPGVNGPSLAADPTLGEIAARLARHQAELEAVRDEPAP